MPLNAETLSFDCYDRSLFLSEVIARLSGETRIQVLDVGGYPGVLAEALEAHETWTVDLPRHGGGRYVCGSALALPFADGAVDVVVASDVLEHIPPSDRHAVVSEMIRTARRAVIVNGPFDTPGVRWVDHILGDWYRRLHGRPHPWLDEHVRFGPPRLDSVADRFLEKGAQTRIYPNGDLVLWFVAQFAALIAEALPGGQGAETALNQALNRTYQGLDAGTPTYRQAVVAVLPGAIDYGDLSESCWPDRPTITPETRRDDGIREKLSELGRAFSITVEALATLLENANAGDENAGGPSPLDRAYLSALERALAENNAMAGGPSPRPWLQRLRSLWEGW